MTTDVDEESDSSDYSDSEDLEGIEFEQLDLDHEANYQKTKPHQTDQQETTLKTIDHPSTVQHKTDQQSSISNSNSDNDIFDDDFLSPADLTWQQIETILQNYGWTSDKIREAYEGFFYWITKSCEELKIPSDSDDDSCWCYMKTRKKFKVISQVRNMLLNIPSNEASC